MKLTVLQWNIWHKEDISHVVDFLRDHPADIICLQELNVGAQMVNPQSHAPSFLAAQLGMHMHTQEMPVMEEGASYTQAVGIFTKMPILATNHTWINQPTGSSAHDDQYRAYIEAKIQLSDGRDITVGTTQMSYSDQFKDTPRKQAETQALMAQVSRHRAGYIFAGDLNAIPPSNTVELISQQLTNSGPNLLEPTWTTKAFTYHGFEAHTLGWRLDYVFTTADIATQQAQVLPTVFSNHLPILVTLEY